MDPSQMMFPIWGAPPPAALQPPSEDHAAAPNAQAQPFLLPPNPNRGWKRKNPAAAYQPPKNPAAAYQPPALGDLQVQNRAKARRWFKNSGGANLNPNPNQTRKYFFPKNKNNKAAAPRNTTSFIIRAKRAGGIASLVSPCPVTPAVLPTPRLSPSREGLADMAQAQWGVDGYGSMKGLIRLRSSPQPAATSDDDDEGNSSGSDVEEHVEVERRLDHDLSRFEMVYPGRGEDAGGYMLEDEDEYDQDAHVARLEEENLTLKERLFLMEQEVGDMRRRLEALEARFSLGVVVGGGENAVDEAPPQNDSSEDDAERVQAEKQGAMASEKSGRDNAVEQGAACSVKTGGNGVDEQDTVAVLEKTVGNDADEHAVVGVLGKTDENDGDEHGAVGVLGKIDSNNANEQGVVGVLGKTGVHIEEKQQGAACSVKTGGNGVDEQDTVAVLEKTVENDADEHAVVGVLGNTDENDGDEHGAVGVLGKIDSNNANEQGVVGVLGKTGVHSEEKQQGVLGTEKTDGHSTEMVDSALEEKMDEDIVEDEVKLAASQ